MVRNNARSQVGDLEYECTALKQEKQELSGELSRLQDTAAQIQVRCADLFAEARDNSDVWFLDGR